jgi:hypothetical protein
MDNGYVVKEFGVLLEDCVRHGVTEIVVHDGLGEPTSVNQGAIGAALIPIIRVYRDELIGAKLRIDALEKTVECLRSWLEAGGTAPAEKLRML